jgi:hypothetical protein
MSLKVTPKGRNGVVDFDVRGAGEYCHYCQRLMVAYSDTHPTKDHVVPRSRGGRKTVMACITCNNTKGDMMPAEWSAFMLDNPLWWTVAGLRVSKVEWLRTHIGNAPADLPIEYDDPKKQAAFEGVYRKHRHLLRVAPSK